MTLPYSPSPNGVQLLTTYFTEFSPKQLEQFAKLEPLYKEWNEKINVISRKDIDSLYEKHVLHSLSIAASFSFAPGTSIVDIGTGGGFPGVPLAIFYPEVNFLLADSIAKKLKVIEAVAEGIGLTNIKTRHTRAEEIKDQKFDYTVSRAVAPLKDLWRWSKPLLRTKSSVEGNEHVPGLICLKGGNLHQEIQESDTRPRMMEIHELFPLEFFKEKYMLYVPR
jgi:16S rRNA (guanine527-N7)-methyltransferase